MRLKLQLCLTVAVVISCLVIGSGVRAQTATNTTTSGGTTIFPPTNQAAGSGVLFFPQGGNSSLYGIPSDDPALVAAVNDQTTQLVAAINVLTAAVKTLSPASTTATGGSASASGGGGSGGGIYTSPSCSGNGICTTFNTKTGQTFTGYQQPSGGPINWDPPLQ